MNVDEDLAVEVAEEADLSLNASLADSQSNFGDVRYRLIFVKGPDSSIDYPKINIVGKFLFSITKYQWSLTGPYFGWIL